MSDTDQHQDAARHQHSGAVVEDAGVQLDQFILTQPSGLDQVSWLAISSHAERLRTALRSQDHSLALGCAKELVESVARVVLVARGHAAANKPDYLDVLKPAHAELEYQPGPGLAQDAPVRGIAANAMKIAGRLRDLRNDYGTGHGRAATPVIEDEALVLAVEGALLWVRWALRRLEHLLAGQLTPLINDLSQAAYSKKHWAERLLAADIPNLPEEDQRRLGVAVGQRAARGTFVVREAGFEDPLSDPNDAAWPPAYPSRHSGRRLHQRRWAGTGRRQLRRDWPSRPDGRVRTGPGRTRSAADVPQSRPQPGRPRSREPGERWSP